MKTVSIVLFGQANSITFLKIFLNSFEVLPMLTICMCASFSQPFLAVALFLNHDVRKSHFRKFSFVSLTYEV